MTEALTLDETLSLAEKLQRAEARALAAEQRLAEQTALVEQYRKELHSVAEDVAGTPYEQQLLELLKLTPTAALSDYRDEVLEEVASRAEKDGYYNVQGLAVITAAEIRAMKGAK